MNYNKGQRSVRPTLGGNCKETASSSKPKPRALTAQGRRAPE